MQIAIDGPASSGKSTISKKIAQKNGMIYLDTGAMYRVATLASLRANVDVNNESEIMKILPSIQISFKQTVDGQCVYLNDEDVTSAIRQPEVTNHVSYVASHKAVREEMVLRQRKIASNHSIIMDGRDIGTVVLPKAEIKIFLIASAQERARRRFIENEQRGIQTDYEQLLSEIIQRDYIDSTRIESPLKKAEDAIEIDSTYLTIDEVVEKVTQLIQSFR